MCLLWFLAISAVWSLLYHHCYSCKKAKLRLHSPILTVVHAEVVCVPKILPIGIFFSQTLRSKIIAPWNMSQYQNSPCLKLETSVLSGYAPNNHHVNFLSAVSYGVPNQSIFPLYFGDPVYFLHGQFDFLYDQLFTFYVQLEFLWGQLFLLIRSIFTFYIIKSASYMVKSTFIWSTFYLLYSQLFTFYMVNLFTFYMVNLFTFYMAPLTFYMVNFWLFIWSTFDF